MKTEISFSDHVAVEQPIRADVLVLQTLIQHGIVVSRSWLHKMWTQAVLIDHHTVKKNLLIKRSVDVDITYLTCRQSESFQSSEIVKQPVNFEIIYEDDYLLVINKPNWTVVHPAPGHYDHTLVNGLYFYNEAFAQYSDQDRPGIVHRLDQNTTGLMVVAKSNQVLVKLQEQLQKRTLVRKYLALCHGYFTDFKIKIDAPIGRNRRHRTLQTVRKAINPKFAVTTLQVVQQFSRHALVLCQLATGRTHQIRVHLQFIGHPIVGDNQYGVKREPLDWNYGQYLHACFLQFKHPVSKQTMMFDCCLPWFFQKQIENLSQT